MKQRRAVPDALLHDSFVSLRIADRIVREFGSADATNDEGTAVEAADLHQALTEAHREIAGLLRRLDDGRDTARPRTAPTDRLID